MPDSFLTGSVSNGITNQQSKESSTNDVHRMLAAIATSKQDVVHFFTEVATAIYGEEPEVVMPTVSFATLDSIMTLHDNHVIDAQPTRDAAAHAAGVPEEFVIRNGGPLREPPIAMQRRRKPASAS